MYIHITDESFLATLGDVKNTDTILKKTDKLQQMIKAKEEEEDDIEKSKKIKFQCHTFPLLLITSRQDTLFRSTIGPKMWLTVLESLVMCVKYLVSMCLC